MFSYVRSYIAARNVYRKAASAYRANGNGSTAQEMIEAFGWYQKQLSGLRLVLGRKNPVLLIAG